MNRLSVTPGMPGAARVEYYACREDVEAILAQGYNAKNVYDHMKEQGRITCSYSAFCDYVRGSGKRKHSKKSKRPFKSVPLPERNNSTVGKTQNNPFINPRDFDVKDLF